MSANGSGVVWAPEVGFVGDATLVARAKTAARDGFLVRIHPLMPEVEASDRDAVAVYAALTWACGGRGLLLDAPVSLLEMLDEATDEDEQDIVPEGQLEFPSMVGEF